MNADVALVAAPLSVLDADLSFEVKVRHKGLLALLSTLGFYSREVLHAWFCRPPLHMQT